MKRVVTAQEMREYEQVRFQDGRASSLDWMERAAHGVDLLLQTRYPARRVLCVCGTGNNGGDGVALLRMLSLRGVACAGVLLGNTEKLSGDARTNYQRALDCNVAFYHALSDDLLQSYDVLVDAMFGTGLSRPLTGIYADAVQRMNASGKPIVAVDIPSGVDATNCAILGSAIHANNTVTFEFYKRGQLLFPGRGLCGEVVVHPLSEERELEQGDIVLFEREDVARLLPKRAVDSHKGKNGRALLCVGSERYLGAALLSVGAALRVGAGLTTAAVPGKVKPAFAALPEAMCIPVNAGSDWDSESCTIAAEQIQQKNAICIGCGVGDGDITPLIVAALESKKPVVLDADALNQLAKRPELFHLLHPDVILTPHPAEMARLSGEPTDAIVSDPIGIAQTYAKRWNCVVLLKGATTCISNGVQVRLNTSGNAGLSKGGSGDVLSGLITGLLAQGLSAFDAACCGAFLLGASADTALNLLQERMLLARDVISAVEQTIQGIQ